MSRDLTQGFYLDAHCVTSVISSSRETTLVCPVSTALARFRNRSSQVQKYSAFAITADARWSASRGLIPSAWNFHARSSMLLSVGTNTTALANTLRAYSLRTRCGLRSNSNTSVSEV